MSKAFLALWTLILSVHAQNKTEVIYGSDDRKDFFEVDAATARLADSTVAIVSSTELRSTDGSSTLMTIPYNETLALCSTERFLTQPTAGRCSGFLVSPDLVLTAGHCMSDDVACSGSRIIFGFALLTPTQTQWNIPSEDIYQCQEIVHTVTDPQSDKDFAVIRLDRAVTNHTPLRVRTEGEPAVGDSVMVMGHPMGLPLKIAGNAHVRSVGQTQFVSNLDTFEGNSGSAVLNVNTGLVEGILVQGETDFDYENGCYVSHHCTDDGCAGESATLMSQVLPYLD